MPARALLVCRRVLVSPRAYDLLFALAASPAALGGWMLIRQRSSTLRRWGGLAPLALGVAIAGSMSRCAQPVVVASEVDHVVHLARRIDLGTPVEGTRVVNETSQSLAVVTFFQSPLAGEGLIANRTVVAPGERMAVPRRIDYLGDELDPATADRADIYDHTWIVAEEKGAPR